MAENLEHMHHEETEHNAVLWDAYSDAELEAIERALIASVAPDEMAAVARWMLPAMTAPDRAAKLTEMQAGDAAAGLRRHRSPCSRRSSASATGTSSARRSGPTL